MSKKKIVSKPDYPPIRMTRAAGARNALVMQRHKMEQSGLATADAEVLNNKDIDHLGLPNAHALDLLRRVSAEVNAPFKPLGISVSDKLNSVQADPAVELLARGTTWKDFFARSRSANRIESQDRPSTSQTGHRPSRDTGEIEFESENSDFNARRDAFHLPIEAVSYAAQRSAQADPLSQFLLMSARVEELWSELCISREDVLFYRKSLLRLPARSVPGPAQLQHMAELAKYIQQLQAHRTRTILVLQAVDAREAVLHRCYDVLAAVHRRQVSRGRESRFLQRLRKVGSDDHSLNKTVGGNLDDKRGQHAGPGTSGEPTAVSEFTDTTRLHLRMSVHTLKAQSRSHDGGDTDIDEDGFWKEELVGALHDLQLASLEVIRRVQLWRRQLWRPRPFFWLQRNAAGRGLVGGVGSGADGLSVDYLRKMRADMAVLEAPVFARLLRAVPLGRADLRCVIFPDTSVQVQVQPKNHEQDQVPVPESLDEHPSWTSPLRDAFLHGLVPAELTAATKVVQSHDELVAALAEEKRQLQAAGVFIPTLKLFPSQTQAQAQAQVQAQAQAHAHAHAQGQSQSQSMAPSSNGLQAEGGEAGPGAGPQMRHEPRDDGSGVHYTDDFE